ncbi:hypothetical protein BOX15_Mlig024601g2, partial [Macrostomum lignano]
SSDGIKKDHNQLLLRCIGEQLAELDLLLSMYPDEAELKIEDFVAVDELRRLVSEADVDAMSECQFRIGFTFRIIGTSNLVVLECICRLSGAYPIEKPPGLFLRSDWLSRDRLRLASEALANQLEEMFKPGEPVLYQMLSWLTEFVSTNIPTDEDASASTATEAGAAETEATTDQRLSRLWIHSHHIYNSLKRRDILNWSAELRLTGFSIVGKPGIVCVEGPESAVEEFWQRLRRLNWKKLTMKEKDVCPPDATEAVRRQFKKFDDFRELSFNARPGRGREVLQDWGLVIRFLEDKGLGRVIPVYFGNLTSSQ